MNSVYLYGVKEITQGFAGKIGTFLKSKKPARKQAFLCMAPLTGLELHLHLLLLLPLLNIAIFLPTYLPSLLFSCGKNVN